MSEFKDTKSSRGWFDWLTGSDKSSVVDIITTVPIDLVIEKLRGFITDHSAEIVQVQESELILKVDSTFKVGGRRNADQRIRFQVKLTLSEAQKDELLKENLLSGGHTKVHLELKPIRSRDRRKRELETAVRALVDSFRCYLMGHILNKEVRPDVLVIQGKK